MTEVFSEMAWQLLREARSTLLIEHEGLA